MSLKAVLQGHPLHHSPEPSWGILCTGCDDRRGQTGSGASHALLAVQESLKAFQVRMKGIRRC